MSRRKTGAKPPAPPKKRSVPAASLRVFKPKVEDDPTAYRRRPKHPLPPAKDGEDGQG